MNCSAFFEMPSFSCKLFLYLLLLRRFKVFYRQLRHLQRLRELASQLDELPGEKGSLENEEAKHDPDDDILDHSFRTFFIFSRQKWYRIRRSVAKTGSPSSL